MAWSRMLTLVAIAFAAFAVVAAASARVSWQHVPYPAHPEGSILTGGRAEHAQFIIMVDKKNATKPEIDQLFVLARVRDDLVRRFHLQIRPGHTPAKGYRLACLARTRVSSATIWLASWAARDSFSDSMNAFSAMTNTKWHGGCATAKH